MLSREENELLCRVGRDTQMGQAVRHFWMPAFLSSELPEPGGDPLHIELLNENLVAFRDHNGQLGLLDEMCCHRGASLTAGRSFQGADQGKVVSCARGRRGRLDLPGRSGQYARVSRLSGVDRAQAAGAGHVWHLWLQLCPGARRIARQLALEPLAQEPARREGPSGYRLRAQDQPY